MMQRNVILGLGALALAGLFAGAPAGPRAGADQHAGPRFAAVPRIVKQSAVGTNVAPDGTQIQNDLPQRFHLKNRGGSDGSGLCVFCSLNHASIWQHVHPTEKVFEWMWRYPGGGYPQKVDKVIAQIAAEKGVEVPDYIQVENRDLEILKLACRTGRSPNVTYNFSPTGRYGGQKIAHMVSLMHLDDKWACILDNNFPGTFEWMDVQTFLSVYTGGRGNGWAVIFLDPGPPPPPYNRASRPLALRFALN
jgi:hypothetical protein